MDSFRGYTGIIVNDMIELVGCVSSHNNNEGAGIIMGKIIKFFELETDKETEMTLLVVGVKDKGKAKNGNPFVAVELSDGDKHNSINFFNETIESLNEKGVAEGSILKIKVTHGSSGFYNQSGWNINDDNTITKRDFLRAAPIDPDERFAWLITQVESVETGNGDDSYMSLASLAKKMLEENAEAFKNSSAAVFMHHNFLSGLLYHTVRMVELAQQFCIVYPSLDKELMICATALHDIGKIHSYNTTETGEASITFEGRLLEHAVIGIMMIHDAAKEGNYNEERLKMLEHMIASHHGKKEWDAITTPAFPEAEMLHLIDLADSRMNMFEEAYKGQARGSISSSKVFGLENSVIYKSSSANVD